MAMRAAARPGFTLVEMLVSSLLVGMVLAMAMKGFTEAKRSGDLVKSKAVASDEAVTGVKTLATLLKRSAIIYYTGKPLRAGYAGPAAPTAGQLFPIPVNLLTLAGGNTLIQYNIGAPLLALPAQSNPTFRGQYRFQDGVHPAGGMLLTSAAAPASRLQSAELPVPANPEDRYFTSPLVYFAEAHFDRSNISVAAGPAQGQDMFRNTPLFWTFYVAYLAPMDLQPRAADHSLAPATAGINGQRDRGTAVAPNPTWQRSTIPFELRLLTVSPVFAVTGPTFPVTRATNFNRQADASGVLPVPFDVTGGSNTNMNYDPTRIAAGNTGLLAPASNPFALAGFGAAAPERVRRGGNHSNLGALGNEPPTNEVFGVGAPQASDRVLARYIDPDSVNGTFFRFFNDSLNNSNPANWFRPGQRLLNGYEGGHQHNSLLPIPTRAVLSITTRFRTGRDIGFQFSTYSEEVSLETSEKYQADTTSRLTRQ